MATSHRWFAAALSLVPLGVRPSGAQAPAGARPAEIHTAASASRNVRPDLAIVTFSFTADGSSPSDAGHAVALRADSLRGALVALGIPRDSLISGNQWWWWQGRVELVTVHQRYLTVADPDGGSHRVTLYDTLYRSHDAIEMHLRNLPLLGAAIDTALAHRILQISGIRYLATDITRAQDDALREATRLARRQAEAIADAAGVKLGRIASLSTQREYGSVYDRDWVGLSTLAISGSSSQPGAGTEVIQPWVTVQVTVYGHWEIAP